jgi:hypothetical protein
MKGSIIPELIINPARGRSQPLLKWDLTIKNDHWDLLGFYSDEL